MNCLSGAHSEAWKIETPAVQHDTKTGAKKVMTFLNDVIFDKYGYRPHSAYGFELDEKDELLVF